jgi:hypothetical protein
MQRTWEGADCSNLQQLCAQEWILPNGVGGYASQSLLGVSTRAEHSLLMAMTPEGQRRSLLARLEDSLGAQALATHQYPNAFWPASYRSLCRILIEPSPLWVFDLGSHVVSRRIEVAQGRNATRITYHLLRGEPAVLRLKPLFAFREQHERRHKQDGLEYSFAYFRQTLTMLPEGEPLPCVLHLGEAEFHASPDWFFRFVYERDQEAGRPHEEDLFTPGVISVELSQEKPFSCWVVADLAPPPSLAVAPAPTPNTSPQEPGRFYGPLLIARQIARRRSLIQLRDQLRESARAFFWVDPEKRVDLITALHTPTTDQAARLLSLPGLCLGADRCREGLLILTRSLQVQPATPETQEDLWALLLWAWAASQLASPHELAVLLHDRVSWLLSLPAPALVPLYTTINSVPLRVAGLWYWALVWLHAQLDPGSLRDLCEERAAAILSAKAQLGDPSQPYQASTLWAFAMPKSLFSGVEARPHLDAIREKLLTSRGLRASEGETLASPAWLGLYTSAYLNAYGDNNAAARDHVEQSLLSLLPHLESERCVGFISESFDDEAPYAPRGAVAFAPNIAEPLRALALLGIKE